MTLCLDVGKLREWVVVGVGEGGGDREGGNRSGEIGLRARGQGIREVVVNRNLLRVGNEPLLLMAGLQSIINWPNLS